jgi:hypothetical protein
MIRYTETTLVVCNTCGEEIRGNRWDTAAAIAKSKGWTFRPEWRDGAQCPVCGRLGIPFSTKGKQIQKKAER